MASAPAPGGEGAASGTSREGPKWDKNRDGIPDVLDDPAERERLLKKYGYSEGDLNTSAKRKLFYEAVRKEYSKKEAKKAYDEVYVNDEATVKEIVADSGFTMDLIQRYPELRDVFKRLSDMLARGKITEETLYAKFKELIGKTDFGKRTDEEIAADLDRYGKNNEANWKKRVADTVTRITRFLTTESGQSISERNARRIAVDLIYAGKETDPQAIADYVREWMVSKREPVDPENPQEPGDIADVGGQRGSWQAQLLTWLSRNGVMVTQNEMNKWLDDIASGATDIEQIKQQIRNTRFSVDYAGFADEFARGMDVADIALNYQAAMANLLEKNVEDIGLDDPLVQRAMQRRGDDGKAKPMTRYEFEAEVRNTDEWQKTTNAMSMYTDIGESLLRSFGFRG